jgi:DNA polymerase
MLENERQQTGHATMAEGYWGGFTDALHQSLDLPVRANIDWASDGVARMFSKQETDKRIADKIRVCEACGLCETRQHAVPGEGPLWTPFMCVGRDPGKHEDDCGRPFVGASGEFLFNSQTGLIPTTMGYQREHVRISNVNRCKSPGNRGPTPEEVLSCGPYLRWEILNVYPKVILALGRQAASWFAGRDVSIGDVRGKPLAWENSVVVATYHPSYVLRNDSPQDLVDKVKADLEVALAEIRRKD